MDAQTPLDITKYATKTVDELKAAIVHDVELTQSRSIIQPLPDALLLRADQFDLLQDDADMMGMYSSDNVLYRTPLNVMEIRVQK